MRLGDPVRGVPARIGPPRLRARKSRTLALADAARTAFDTFDVRQSMLAFTCHPAGKTPNPTQRVYPQAEAVAADQTVDALA